MAARPSIPLLALAAALALPAAAAAHTGLRASAPASGDTVADTLRSVRLEFTQRVAARTTSLVLTCGGQPFAEGQLAEEPGSAGRAFVFHPPRLLPPGPCAVAWRTASADGHAIHGTIAFTVAATLPPDTAVASSPIVDSAAASADDSVDEDDGVAAWAEPSSALSVVVRWGGFLALLGMIGAAAFHLLVLRRAVKRTPALAPVAARAVEGAWHLALAAAALSALTLLARLWLQSAALYGPEYAFDGVSLDTLVTETVWGLGWGLQALATVAFVVGLMVARAKHGHGVGWMGAGLATLLLSAVPALSGHAAAVEGWTAAAILSDWFHVLGAGAWLGTLGVLLLAGLPAAAAAPEGERTAAFAALVGAFSPVALAGAGLAGVTGVISSLFHFSAISQLWGTGYGRALLIKLALLAVVAALGFWNWRYITPNLHAADGPRRLHRNVALELATGAAVLLATAILVALPPP